MNNRLTHAAEVSRILRERLASHDWWIFVPLDRQAVKVLETVERSFYWDEAGNDFDVAILPTSFLAIAFGKKTRLSKRALQRLLRKKANQHVTIGERDVIVFGGNEFQAAVATVRLEDLISAVYPEMN